MHDGGAPKNIFIFWGERNNPEYLLLQRNFGTRIEGHAREISCASQGCIFVVYMEINIIRHI